MVDLNLLHNFYIKYKEIKHAGERSETVQMNRKAILGKRMLQQTHFIQTHTSIESKRVEKVIMQRAIPSELMWLY